MFALLCVALGALGPGHGASGEASRGRFQLLDQTGRKVTNEDFLGRFMLVFFGYTYCPDVCPTDLQVLARALDLVGPAGDKVQPIFITIDPERDSPEVLRDYVRHFHPRLLGLTGSPAAVRRAANLYRVQFRKVFGPDHEDGKPDYLIDHSAASYLIGPDGAGLSLYPHGMTAEDIAADIRAFVEKP